MHAERAASVARPAAFDDARHARAGVEPDGQLRRLEAHDALEPVLDALVREHEHPLRGQVERAVSEQAPVVHAADAAARA